MEPFSFITEVAGQKLPDPHELLIPVKADHVKLQEVIGMFSKKVDSLVDKQRHEYTQAYEYHMFDIQKELHRLREKAAQIANDTTRDEKLANLDKDQKWYRAEAMRLDMETNQMRRVLQALTGKITSAGITLWILAWFCFTILYHEFRERTRLAADEIARSKDYTCRTRGGTR